MAQAYALRLVLYRLPVDNSHAKMIDDGFVNCITLGAYLAFDWSMGSS